MVTISKFRNEDLSVYFFVKDLLGDKVQRVVDGYPYTEIEEGALEIPSVSVEHTNTYDDGGELGASWYGRSWAIDVFADTDVKRDELAHLIFDALDRSIPIKDYSAGFRRDGTSLAGTDLRVIEYATVSSRSMRPTYAFASMSEKKFWRMVITFNTMTTRAE